MTPSPAQSTVVAVGFLLLIGLVAGIALHEYGVDDFLKVWAVLGTLLGVVVGAIPAFFFAVSTSKAQDERARSEEKVQTLLAVAGADALSAAAEQRPDLFAAAAKPKK